MSMNLVAIYGRMGKDPELKTTQGGTAVCTMSVATDEYIKKQGTDGKKETTWHNIVAFGKLAEICHNYGFKGGRVFMLGRIRLRKWEDKEGKTQYRTDIVVNQVEMLDMKSDKGSPEKGEGGQGPDDDVPF